MTRGRFAYDVPGGTQAITADDWRLLEHHLSGLQIVEIRKASSNEIVRLQRAQLRGFQKTGNSGQALPATLPDGYRVVHKRSEWPQT